MTVTMPLSELSDAALDGVSTKIDEIRHSLSTEAEHLAEMRIARDPLGSTSGWLAQLLTTLAEIGAVLAVAGRRFARDAGESAQSLAQDLRQVRITTESRKTGANTAAAVTLLAGLGAGAALMYFLDRERGRARRRAVRDRFTSAISRKQPKVDPDEPELWSVPVRPIDPEEATPEPLPKASSI